MRKKPNPAPMPPPTAKPPRPKRAPEDFVEGSKRVLSEDMVSLLEACSEFPAAHRQPKTGRLSHPCYSTVLKWTRFGVRGVYLDAARVGNSIVTSRQAVRRFLAASALPTPTREDREAEERREADEDLARRAAAADEKLRRMGL